MPSKSIKQTLTGSFSGSEQTIKIQICDIILVLVFALILGTMIRTVYHQVYAEENVRQEKSIVCIKEFDTIGCNPFNMTATCQEKLKCIKDGDGLGTMDIVDLVNKHIKNNGALPAFMILLVIINELRRRY